MKQWRIQDFPEEGAPIQEGANILFAKIFPKTAWKWRNVAQKGAHILHAPLDPLLWSVHLWHERVQCQLVICRGHNNHLRAHFKNCCDWQSSVKVRVLCQGGGVGGAHACTVWHSFRPVRTHRTQKKFYHLWLDTKFKMANGKQSSDWTIIQNGRWACDWTRSQDGGGKSNHLIGQ